MIETWLDVVGIDNNFGRHYQVSDFGRVRAKPEIENNVKGRVPGKIIFQSKDDRGYSQVGLCNNYKQKTVKVHRLVALAFIGARENKMTVNHKDGNKGNNALSNLEYVTNADNAAHAAREIRGRCLIVDGRKFSLREAVENFGGDGVTYDRARSRIYRHKWEPEYAVKTPVGRTGRPSKETLGKRQKVEAPWG